MNMEEYSLLIVDDEELVRSAIGRIIDWRSLGFTKILEAEDGEEALKICRKNKIHLVMTDIVMPFMDGMELSHILSEEFPDIHIVILTGHEEFQYAKKSIQYGVKNYILKPIGAESLYKEMKGICEMLHMQRNQKQYIAKMRSQLHESLPILREKFLYSLVCTSYYGRKDHVQRIQSLDIPLYSQAYIVGIIETDVSTVDMNDMELYLFAIKNICMDTVGNQHCVFDDNNRSVIIFNLDRYGEEYQNIAYDTMEVILKAIQITMKIPSAGALGGRVKKVHELHQSYCEAIRALECRYIMGYDQIYDIHDINYMDSVFTYPTDEIKQFIDSMKFKSYSQMKDAIERIEKVCRKNRNFSIANIKMIYFELLNSIMKELFGVKNGQKELWKKGLSLYQTMDRINTINKLSEEILIYAEQVSMSFQAAVNSSSRMLIQKAKDYIELHYMEAELSQNMVANSVGISTGYLSGLFKKEGGVNFIEYLTNIRMEHAMQLIRTSDKKNYEIAEETGFSNPHYFSISFKKYSKMSPSEYRNRR